jgi:hypothetical protein
MDLQTDPAGNFYYAKAARHGKPALVPQHGTLLRVNKEGTRTDILATGFRAPNGVCINPDGTFFMSDQEGHWIPKNRINLVKQGGFYGNMWGYHDVTDPSDDIMQKPLCWITNEFDRSPAELIYVDSPAWGPLKGAHLSLSYGYGKIFVVPHEKVDGQIQGGMAALPIVRFPTGVMRGRFHPGDGQLYVCGLYGWAGNQTQAGGLYRVRCTGQPVYVPLGLAARRGAIDITFSGELSHDSASAVSRFTVKAWSLKRTTKYGSKHYDEHQLKITRQRLSDDGRVWTLEIPELAPTWCMEIQYAVKEPRGALIQGVIHNTINRLKE